MSNRIRGPMRSHLVENQVTGNALTMSTNLIHAGGAPLGLRATAVVGSTFNT